MPKESVRLQMDQEWIDRIDAAAKQRRWTRSEFIRFAVEEALTDREEVLSGQGTGATGQP